jgi:decaprenyl-phosphate phosphoribosyltransferase
MRSTSTDTVSKQVVGAQPSPGTASVWAAYVRVLRPRQWTKNLIVFAAPLFAFSLDLDSLLRALLAFTLFCLASSSFYILNDAIDAESDRQHPIKCKRPIAAGLISVPIAISIAALLLTGALFWGWTIGSGLGIAVTGYALLQVAYNLRLKHIVILDVVAIAIGFVLRAFAGAAATNIVLSPWFLLCTAMLALFLGVEKRKAELRLAGVLGGKRRRVLWRYSPALLNRMENVVTTGTIMTYALWSFGPQLHGASSRWMMITLPFVLYGLFRYQLLSDPQEIAAKAEQADQAGGTTERPEEVLLSDRPLLLNILAWLVTTFAVLLLVRLGILK